MLLLIVNLGPTTIIVSCHWQDRLDLLKSPGACEGECHSFLAEYNPRNLASQIKLVHEAIQTIINTTSGDIAALCLRSRYAYV